MNNAKQVDANIEARKKSGMPLSDAVWETALDCVDWPYVFGAWGEECTPDRRKRRARDDHPTIVSKCQVLSGSKGSCLGCRWYPDGERVRMFDCRGFTDWCLKQFGIDLQGEGASSQWRCAENWEAKGTIDTIPDDILCCLFVKDKDKANTMSHTGLGYKGGTCECSSGVQYFEKRKTKWSHWAVPRGIGGNMPEYRPTLRRGDKGPYVREAQEDLLRLGYELPKYGADGDFGRETESAVKEMQKDYGLAVDGVIGPKTWEVLTAGEPKPVTYYTVTVPHLKQADAEKLVSQYPGATMTQEG